MRRLLATGCGMVLLLYLLPIFLSFDIQQTTPSPVAVPVQQTTETVSTDADDIVTVLIDGVPTELPLENYVEGVVSAEAPDDFPIAALRAQAIAARTYAVYKMMRGRPEAHPNADLCDDFEHCAAYRAPTTAVGGDGGSNIRQAVQDTAGQILTYQDIPIAAVFHCASAPRTEAAVDVWGEDVPYLQSVVSPGGSACADYEGTVTLSAEEFREKVRDAFPEADVSGSPETWFTDSERTTGGGIRTVRLCGATVEGTALRDLFGLHSTNFTITTNSDSLSFHTVGYGHCVGLSQYGARYMAEQGADEAEILSHYYPGTVLSSLSLLPR